MKKKKKTKATTEWVPISWERMYLGHTISVEYHSSEKKSFLWSRGKDDEDDADWDEGQCKTLLKAMKAAERCVEAWDQYQRARR